MVSFIVILILLFACVFILAFLAGADCLKNQYLGDHPDKKDQVLRWMKTFWAFYPSTSVYFLFGLFIVLLIFGLFMAKNEVVNEGLKKYAEGQIVKVVTYKEVHKPGAETYRDSTFRYEKK